MRHEQPPDIGADGYCIQLPFWDLHLLGRKVNWFLATKFSSDSCRRCETTWIISAAELLGSKRKANHLLPSGINVTGQIFGPWTQRLCVFFNLPYLLGDIPHAVHIRCQTSTFQDRQAVGRKELNALYSSRSTWNRKYKRLPKCHAWRAHLSDLTVQSLRSVTERFHQLMANGTVKGFVFEGSCHVLLHLKSSQKYSHCGTCNKSMGRPAREKLSSHDLMFVVTLDLVQSIFKSFIYSVMGVGYTCHSLCVAVRGQVSGVCSLLPLYGTWVSNSSC